MDEMEDKEKVYDEQIHPLLMQIRTICQEHGMPHVCIVQFNGGLFNGGYVTTFHNMISRGDYCSMEIRQIAAFLDHQKDAAQPGGIHDYEA